MNENKKHTGLRIFITIIVIGVVLIMLGGFIGYTFINSKLNKIKYEDIDKSQIEITEGV